MLLNRRALLGHSAALTTLAALTPLRTALGQTEPSPPPASGDPSGLATQPFSYDALILEAEVAAKRPYVAPPRPRPDITATIDYATWGAIKFRTDKAPFATDGAYPVTFFHLGQYFQSAVRMHIVRDGMATEVTYSPDLFDMPADSPARRLPPDSGFAGFRFQEWSGSDDWRSQDWLAFLGASYLRAIGASGQYGLSARGVAINPALPDTPEEFPSFTAFYIAEQTDPEAPVVVCARLDGPSITGAYRFTARRGTDRTQGVTIDVEASLFLRQDVARLCLMPVTSMFWFGENGRERPFDWRPEVHDSDGLALWLADGERIWRPLNNPTATRVSAFGAENPRGFGLMQRDREFDHYRDGVFYDRRPSLWVEPLAPLGRGAIQLLEIPTNDEIHDNIGAFWVPEGPARAGASYRLRYRMHWRDSTPYPAETVAQVVSTRYGRGGQPGLPRPDGVYKIAVEFDRPEVLTRIPYGVMPEVVVSTSAGEIVRTHVEPVPGGNVWRAFFDLKIPADTIAEVRLYLALNGEPLTETWAGQFDAAALFPAR
ncbi:glucan biosynthesis protein D [Roseospira marina]|uniref:Glucan biosynthesis protein D n=1 Tax=Roseospira marina TaxID=140057 RepID=A0A5M6IC55_9PROT|nr:glucan biosynthesis protein [Roseospira marina]KAA5605783.1 glucan biosynthesis protein D [Roseospira marina]MBB4313594.1 glucans biosynthesis protein [Roseospira marina]MBB5086756.1 glucans biosynthesis protein [Roseospira marina]